MANEIKENQDRPQVQPEKEKPSDQAKAAADDNKTVLEKFDDQAAENIKKIEDAFEERIPESKIAEIALTRVREMKEAQKAEIRTTFKNFKQQFETNQIQNKTDREALAAKLLQEAQNIADARINSLEAVLGMLVKPGQYMTEQDVVALKKILVGIEKISAEDLKTQEILNKLRHRQKSGEQLSDDDYDHIIKMIKPFDLTTKGAKPQENFDATSAGIIVGFMNPVERYKLVQKYMESPDRTKTAELIDGFLRTGILNVAQGEELFQEAMKKQPPIISEAEFRNTYQKNLKNGFYVDEARRVQEALQQQVRDISGEYANNKFERFASTPMVGFAVLTHSFFWILTNVLASGGDFGTMFRNPFLWAAVGEAALALEMTTGSTKRGTGDYGIGAGWISSVVRSITEEGGQISSTQENAYKIIGETYLSYPDFGSYLENGGAATIIRLRKAKAASGAKGSDLAITFDELFQAEASDSQKSLLKAAQDRFPKQINVQINSIAEATTVLELSSEEEFNKKLGYIKDAQGLKGSPSKAAPASSPASVPQALVAPQLSVTSGTPKIVLPDGQ